MPPSHVKINLQLNVAPLRCALNAHPGLFGQLPFREFLGSPHEEMKDIWVRFNDLTPFLERESLEGFTDEHDSVWYEVADKLPEVRPLVFSIMSAVEGERLGGILITRLPPGGKIQPHRDSGWHAEYYQKYYVPIQNAPGATFEFEDGTISPEEGDVYWFNNSFLHWVNNRSNTERIAMIVCIKTDRLPQGVAPCHGYMPLPR